MGLWHPQKSAVFTETARPAARVTLISLHDTSVTSDDHQNADEPANREVRWDYVWVRMSGGITFG